MRTCAIIIAFFVFSSTLLLTVHPTTANELEVKNVERTLAEYEKAIKEKDLNVLETLVVDDFRLVDHEGLLLTKKEFIDQYKESDFTLEVAKSKNVTIRVYGEMAIANGEWSEKGRRKGKAYEHSQRYTTVFAKQKDVWRFVSDHVTTIK